MDEAKKFADGVFRIDCGRIVLHVRDGKPPIAEGPGEIWQDEDGRLRYKIFVNQAAYFAIVAFISRLREIGSIIPDEDFLTLESQSYSLPVWVSPRVLPSLSGGLLVGGLATGELHDLFYTTSIAHDKDTCGIAVRIKGRLNFPCNQGTETVVRVGGKDRATTNALNAAFFEVENFKFELLQESEHTVFSLRLPASEMTPHTHLRMIEALQFVLGRELSMMSTEIVSMGQHETRLVSPRNGEGHIPPPLQFRNIDEGGNIWRMLCDYFMFIRTFDEPRWHPLSRHIGSVIEASTASINAQALALAVAIEGLAADCFQDLAPSDPQLLADIAAAEKALAEIKLVSSERILGALNPMKKPRNSDLVREFVSRNGLANGLRKSWSKLRNSSAHGDADAHEIAKLLKLQREALSLLYSMALRLIGYSGPRTDYSIPNWPEKPWPVPAAVPPPE